VSLEDFNVHNPSDGIRSVFNYLDKQKYSSSSLGNILNDTLDGNNC